MGGPLMPPLVFLRAGKGFASSRALPTKLEVPRPDSLLAETTRPRLADGGQHVECRLHQPMASQQENLAAQTDTTLPSRVRLLPVTRRRV